MSLHGRNARFLALGAGAGAAAGLLARPHSHWLLQHPGTVALGTLGLVAIAAGAVQLRMNRAVRAHEAREDAFGMAMIAQFAPHLLGPAELLLGQPAPTRDEASATLGLNVVQLPVRPQPVPASHGG